MPNEINQNIEQPNTAETDTVNLPESTDTSGNINTKRAIGIILCVCSVVFTIISFCMVNNSKYEFYKDHYRECYYGYNEAVDNAYSLGRQFRNNFLDIAHTYKVLMEKDMANIYGYQIGAAVFGVCGGLSMIIGIVMLIKSTSKIKNP